MGLHPLRLRHHHVRRLLQAGLGAGVLEAALADNGPQQPGVGRALGDLRDRREAGPGPRAPPEDNRGGMFGMWISTLILGHSI